MAAIKFLSWDGDVANGIAPRRPSTEDLGGDHYVDDSEFPPDFDENPSADSYNQLVKQTAAKAKALAACKLEVRFSGGTPFVARATGPKTGLAASTFTPVDVGIGVTDVTWPANTFPPHQCSPTGLTLLSNAAQPCTGHVEEISNGIRVRTFQNGVAADIPWTIVIN